jgi:glucuronate isomerase
VLGEFFGMLTDSRSFLSYARHDYFRRILCSMVGKWVEAGEFDSQTAVTLVQRISYQNIKDWMGETR